MLLAATGGAVLAEPGRAGAVAPHAVAQADKYGSNTEIYADASLREGEDYGRRFRRHGAFDDSLDQRHPFPQLAVIAPHGGGIETGTSELCLAIAGYHPADLTPIGGPVYDYWMFEGLLDDNNGELHVTATNCDDPVALSLCRGAQSAIALHGCSTATAGVGDRDAVVFVGGLHADLKRRLIDRYKGAGFDARDAAGKPKLAGVDPKNIVNQTLGRAGAQLELTAPLRKAMFGPGSTRANRRHTTTDTFRSFVRATREAMLGFGE